MTKKLKKKKFNIKRFIFFLIILVCIILVCIYFLNKPIKHILIKGNYYLSDETIIETANIENYPSFLRTLSFTIENKISKLPLVKSVKVKKKLNNVIEIDIEEEKVLFIIRNTGEFVLSSKERLSEMNVNVPELVNYVPDDILNKFIDKLSLIDNNVINKISEIEYSPNPYDEERFIFYMNDENQVYVTLNKLSEFNKYNKIKEQIEDNKGILYLDSGNYFEIKD